ncbi:MAG: hypothetical protein P3C10_06790 [Gemmatimonadota bacterium]|nr:hypothetical protein [Gemmatimonadota bacterium]
MNFKDLPTGGADHTPERVIVPALGSRLKAVVRRVPVLAESTIHTALLLSLWFLTRPYQGIVHDARLYTAQAMRKWNPAYLADDLYFRFGSQDAFTLFSFVYAPVIAVLGPSLAHLAATLVSHTLWIAAVLLLVRECSATRREAWLAAFAVVMLNPAYGFMRLFNYGESFATPRVLAEAAVLFSITALLNNRNRLGFGLLAVSAAIHPLMTIPGAAVALFVSTRSVAKTVLIAVALLVGAGVLAVAHVEPFERLLRSFDSVWFVGVASRLPFALVSRWELGNYCGLVLPVFCLVMFRRRAEPVGRMLVDAVLLVSACGLILSWVGADLLRNVLALNLQGWRALWLLMLLGNAVAVPALLAMPEQAVSKRLLTLSLVLTVAESWIRFPALPSGVIALTAAATFVYERRARTPLPPGYATACAVLACIAIAVDLAAGWIYLFEDTAEPVARMQLFGALVIVSGLVAVAWSVRVPKLAQGILAALALACSLYQVDRRSGWKRFVEDDSPSQGLSAFIAPYKNVYWEGGMELLWVKMRRSSYYSCTQGSGLMFFRDLATEYQRRGAVLASLNTEDFDEDPRGFCSVKVDSASSGAQDRSVVVEACRRLPDLDAMVLARPVADVTAAVWRAPTPIVLRENGHFVERRDFFLISCAGLRDVAR